MTRSCPIEPFGIVESVKAANDIFSPVDGEVVERNEDAVAAPETVNSSPFGDAWLVRVKLGDPEQLAKLMDAGEYDAVCRVRRALTSGDVLQFTASHRARKWLDDL